MSRLLLTLVVGALAADQASAPSKALVGAYYFDGWAGSRPKVRDPLDPKFVAPTNLSQRMLTEFAERKPIWGWRDDSQAIMEREIKLAVDNGIGFFAFDWYWQRDGQAFDSAVTFSSSLNSGIHRFMASKQTGLGFCLMVSNHKGYEIRGAANWLQALHAWKRYFADPRYLKLQGRPVLIIFSPGAIDSATMIDLQEESKRMGYPGLMMIGCSERKLPSGYAMATHYNLSPWREADSSVEHPFTQIDSVVEKDRNKPRDVPFVPIVSAGYDHRPWEGPDAEKPKSYYTRDAAAFGRSFRKAIEWMNQNPQRTSRDRLVLVYAWNELGEGGYLVPTMGDPGASLLKEISKALGKTK